MGYDLEQILLKVFDYACLTFDRIKLTTKINKFLEKTLFRPYDITRPRKIPGKGWLIMIVDCELVVMRLIGDWQKSD